MTDSVIAAGDWTWGAVQGDYNEDPTIGQIALNTALTLIPYVDQAGDVRDITANLKYLVIDERYNEKGVWFGLVITVVGCVPEAGSLVKGVFKVILKKIKEGSKVPVEELFEVFNHFAGRGDAKKYLKELAAKLSDYGKFAKDKIKEILNTLIKWLDNAKTFVTNEVAIKLEKLKQSCQKVLNAVDKMVNEVIEDIKQKLDETINKHVDLGQEGSPKTLNERKRVEREPPPIHFDFPFKVGDSIGGIKIDQLSVPKNPSGKVVVVGRDMKMIEKTAKELEEKGYSVEILDTKFLTKVDENGDKFIIDGRTKSLDQCFDDLISNKKYPRDASGRVPYNEVDKTAMYKANMQWVERIKEDGSTIIDTNNPGKLEPSAFYDGELTNIPWN